MEPTKPTSYLSPALTLLLATVEMQTLTRMLRTLDQSLTGKNDFRVEMTIQQQVRRLTQFAFGEGDGESQLYYLSDDGLSRLFIDPNTGKLHVDSVSTARVKWLFEYETGLRLQVEQAAKAVRGLG